MLGFNHLETVYIGFSNDSRGLSHSDTDLALLSVVTFMLFMEFVWNRVVSVVFSASTIFNKETSNLESQDQDDMDSS